MDSKKTEDDKEKEGGKVSKLADNIADGYEAINNIMTKATGETIRSTGRAVDNTIQKSRESYQEGKNPVDKIAKATKTTTIEVVKGTGQVIKDVAQNVGDGVKAITDSADKTVESVKDIAIPSKKKED